MQDGLIRAESFRFVKRLRFAPAQTFTLCYYTQVAAPHVFKFRQSYAEGVS